MKSNLNSEINQENLSTTQLPSEIIKEIGLFADKPTLSNMALTQKASHQMVNNIREERYGFKNIAKQELYAVGEQIQVYRSPRWFEFGNKPIKVAHQSVLNSLDRQKFIKLFPSLNEAMQYRDYMLEDDIGIALYDRAIFKVAIYSLEAGILAAPKKEFIEHKIYMEQKREISYLSTTPSNIEQIFEHHFQGEVCEYTLHPPQHGPHNI